MTQEQFEEIRALLKKIATALNIGFFWLYIILGLMMFTAKGADLYTYSIPTVVAAHGFDAATSWNRYEADRKSVV